MERSKKHLYVCFEGADASYKETNSREIFNYIKSSFSGIIKRGDLNIDYVSFPRYYSDSSYMVRQYLSGAYDSVLGAGSVSATSLLNDLNTVGNLFLMDMYAWYQEKNLQGFFKKPNLVVFDRYYYSMFYYLTPAIYKRYPIARPIDSIYTRAIRNDIIKHPENLITSDEKEILIEYASHSVAKKMRLPEADVIVKMISGDAQLQSKLDSKKKENDGSDIYEDKIEYIKTISHAFKKIDFEPYVSKQYPKEKRIINMETEDKSREDIKEQLIESLTPVLKRFRNSIIRVPIRDRYWRQ